jgi:hypothetical protein
VNGPTGGQHRKMHALWREAGVTDRADRLALTGQIVRRELATSNDLDSREAAAVIEYLDQLSDDGTLARRAAGWLDTYRRGAA